MSCQSCQMVVRYALEKLGIEQIIVEAGRVQILEPITILQLAAFKMALAKANLEFTENTKSLLVDKIISVITEMINYSDSALKVNFSCYLSQKLNHNYTYMANMFSQDQGTTIENYIILHRIEKVKQLICSNNFTLTQISWQMHYSSVAHLSTQFKKITGITPSQYKNIDCKSTLRLQMCEL